MSRTNYICIPHNARAREQLNDWLISDLLQPCGERMLMQGPGSISRYFDSAERWTFEHDRSVAFISLWRENIHLQTDVVKC